MKTWVPVTPLKWLLKTVSHDERSFRTRLVFLYVHTFRRTIRCNTFIFTVRKPKLFPCLYCYFGKWFYRMLKRLSGPLWESLSSTFLIVLHSNCTLRICKDGPAESFQILTTSSADFQTVTVQMNLSCCVVGTFLPSIKGCFCILCLFLEFLFKKQLFDMRVCFSVSE